MVKKTYAALQQQITALSAQAEKLRKVEKDGVIAKIKEAIQVYGITPQELFKTRQSNAKKSKFGHTKKFDDGKGNTWIGRGPRPEWLREALAAGKKLEDFAVAGPKPKDPLKVAAPARNVGATKAPSKRAPKPTKKILSPKFKDGAGNVWSGRGAQPRWIKAALAGGKTLEELRA